MSPTEVDPSPWYRNFWPWFIVILLSISVVASLTTVVIAYRLGNLEAPVDEIGIQSDLQPGADIVRAIESQDR